MDKKELEKWISIQESIKNLGIRSTNIVCEAPKERPSKIISSETCGVEPNLDILFEKIKKEQEKN